MLTRLQRARRQAGDTIVEVIIAIGIVSLILVGAYVTVNRSNNSTQDAQERGQALELVGSQLEFLRSAGSLTAGNTCFASDGTPASLTACVVNAKGVPSTTDPNYTLSISPPDANGVYTVEAEWDNVYGTGKTNVTMYYRLDS